MSSRLDHELHTMVKKKVQQFRLKQTQGTLDPKLLSNFAKYMQDNLHLVENDTIKQTFGKVITTLRQGRLPTPLPDLPYPSTFERALYPPTYKITPQRIHKSSPLHDVYTAQVDQQIKTLRHQIQQLKALLQSQKTSIPSSSPEAPLFQTFQRRLTQLQRQSTRFANLIQKRKQSIDQVIVFPSNEGEQPVQFTGQYSQDEKKAVQQTLRQYQRQLMALRTSIDQATRPRVPGLSRQAPPFIPRFSQGQGGGAST